MYSKTPNDSRRQLKKNNSFDNCDFNNAGRTIYKLHDRLFNNKILSIMSKNNNNLGRNFLKIKNFKFKSFDNQLYLNFSPNKKNLKDINSLIEEDENKQKISFLYHRELKLNKRDSILPNLSLNKGPKNRKKYMLINRIIKFKQNPKIKGNIEFHPIKFRKNFLNFNKNHSLIFNNNFNSDKMNLDNNFLKLEKGFRTTRIELKMKKRKQRKEEEEQEKLLELENKDKMEEMSVDLLYYKKQIKIFLSDETKLNQISIHEEFFNSFVNRVNYLFDDRKFPTIKNNLIKIIMELGTSKGYEWERLNMIEISTLTYLHKLKVKIQRELDEIEEENKIKQFKINQQIGKYRNSLKKSIKKKKRKENKIDNFENNENKGEEEEEKEEEEDLIIEKEDLYNLEEFFFHKSRNNRRILFANDKLAYTVYYNPKFYKNCLTSKSIDKNKKEKNIKKEK